MGADPMGALVNMSIRGWAITPCRLAVGCDSWLAERSGPDLDHRVLRGSPAGTHADRGLGQGTHLQFGPCHQDRGDGAVALPLVDGQQPAFGEIEGHAGELRDQSALLVLG
jgi:hypothetical protein